MEAGASGSCSSIVLDAFTPGANIRHVLRNLEWSHLSLVSDCALAPSCRSDDAAARRRNRLRRSAKGRSGRSGRSVSPFTKGASRHLLKRGTLGPEQIKLLFAKRCKRIQPELGQIVISNRSAFANGRPASVRRNVLWPTTAMQSSGRDWR